MLLVQVVASPEHETNSLSFYQSTRINWSTFFLAKAGTVFVLVGLVSLLNSLFCLTVSPTFIWLLPPNGLTERVLFSFVGAYGSATLYCLPMIFFHLLVSLMIRNAFIRFAVGLLVLLIGMPVVNMTGFIYNPYILLIASRKVGSLSSPLMMLSLLSCLLWVGVFWYRQRTAVYTHVK